MSRSGCVFAYIISGCSKMHQMTVNDLLRQAYVDYLCMGIARLLKDSFLLDMVPR